VAVQDGSENIPVGGEAMFILNQEYRIPIWGRLKGVLFYDAGNVYLEIEDLREFDIRHVLGAGLRVESPIGPLRFEYGRKLDREEGESRGEFFVAIGTAF
jgi:outer membrane protein insertion porin family